MFLIIICFNVWSFWLRKTCKVFVVLWPHLNAIDKMKMLFLKFVALRKTFFSCLSYSIFRFPSFAFMNHLWNDSSFILMRLQKAMIKMRSFPINHTSVSASINHGKLNIFCLHKGVAKLAICKSENISIRKYDPLTDVTVLLLKNCCKAVTFV